MTYAATTTRVLLLCDVCKDNEIFAESGGHDVDFPLASDNLETYLIRQATALGWGGAKQVQGPHVCPPCQKAPAYAP